jgi:hypothetical protein
VAAQVVLDLTRVHSDTTGGTVEFGGRRIPLAVDEPTRVRVRLPHGITVAPIRVEHPGIRCDNVEHDDLPTIAAHLVPRGG